MFDACPMDTIYTATWDTSLITSATDFSHTQPCPVGLSAGTSTTVYGTVAQRCPLTCPSGCHTCTDAVSCTVCVTGRGLFDGDCFACNMTGLNSVDSGYFLNSSVPLDGSGSCSFDKCPAPVRLEAGVWIVLV